MIKALLISFLVSVLADCTSITDCSGSTGGWNTGNCVTFGGPTYCCCGDESSPPGKLCTDEDSCKVDTTPMNKTAVKVAPKPVEAPKINASQTKSRVSFCDDPSAPTQYIYTVADLKIFEIGSTFSGCVIWKSGNFVISDGIWISNDMEIKGDSSDYPVIRPDGDCGKTKYYSIFNIGSGINVKMSFLNIGNGHSADGGCIIVDEEYEKSSDLELHSVYMSDCVAHIINYGRGGCMYAMNGIIHGDDIHYARCVPDDNCYADTSKGPATCP